MKKHNRLVATIFALALALSSITTASLGQQPLDRTKIPAAGKTPELHVPVWTRTMLANGATLIVAERHNLPIVSFSITFVGGSNQFEPATRRGLASITSSMLSEGTTTKSGDDLSNALQLLGTNVGANVGGEEGSIGFTSTAAKFEPTLAILQDMMMNPLFPAEALERLRGRTLVQLTQARDQPAVISGQVFARVLYGGDHPYGQRSSETSIKAITRDDVLAFHKAYYQPARAIITVVGDVNPAMVKRAIERTFTTWTKGGDQASFNYPKPPARGPATIYLVDKPGAAQSVFNIGLPGPPRNTPDYFALQVLNTILGGQFQSRLNYNIREVHAYSYGVNSSFAYGKGPGPFRAGGAIESDKTSLALLEFMKELRGILGERPITDEELTTAKDALIQRLPGGFTSINGIGGNITNLVVQGLPDDYYQNYAPKISAVTREDLLRVAKQYLDLEHLAIVIVGDRAKVEAGLKATGVAPITILDIDGNPATAGTGTTNRTGN